jgi:putative phosphoesterase
VKVAVLTDTHVGSIQELPASMLRAMSEADLIVHAGDFTGTAVLEGLRSLNEVRAVCGNMDSLGIQMALPRKDLLTVAGRRIGVTHGRGAPPGIAGRVRAEFDRADVIVFGHSHMPCNEVIEGALMFNPGRCRRSYGLLTIGDDITAEVVRI